MVAAGEQLIHRPRQSHRESHVQVLELELCETRLWERARPKPGVLLCDARSVPPRVAAGLMLDGKCYFSDWQPSDNVMASFKRRKDDQIMALELLSVAFGALAQAQAG